MTDPVITPASSTLAAATATVPLLSIFGVNLGLRPDLLVAGFFGALVAIILIDSVPASSDTWRDLVRGTLRRMFVAIASAITAGYVTPIVLLAMALPSPLILGLSFVIGAGAQKIVAALVNRAAASAGGAISPDAPRKEG